MSSILSILLWLVAWIPLRILYLLSDIILYPLIYHIVKYRRNVVSENIDKAFPEKSETEKRSIERKFYRHFSDTFVETIALLHMSANELNRRVTYANVDVITNQYKKGKSVVVMTAHYANWEWVIGFSMHLEPEKPFYAIYKKLKNTFFDQFMNDLRSKYGGVNIETKDLYRTMLHMRNEQKIGAFAMISDQSPPRSGIRHWVNFMHQKTPVFVGAEQLAKRFEYPILFLKVEKPKRGYYHCSFEMIAENVKEWGENSITEKYFEMLEQQIKAQPELWLWSHKRWKHKY